MINVYKLQSVGVCRLALAFSLPWVAAAQLPSNYKISNYAGTGGTAGFAGDGGAATTAQFSSPCAAVLDSSGVLYVSDSANNRVRKITADGTISTVAGKGTAAYSGDGKAATDAELAAPCGLALDSAGNLFIADTNNHAIRKVTSGNISTVAGNGIQGYTGDSASATSANLDRPLGVAVDGKNQIYVVDSGNNVIRLVGADGNINTIAGNGVATRAGDGGPALSASLSHPTMVLVDASGSYYVADTDNGVIRLVDASGNITTIAGTSINGFNGDGPALASELSYPKSLARDAAGNLYIADSVNNRIRVMTPDGTLVSIAGNGKFGYSGDGGQALLAYLQFPSSAVVDSNGRVFFVDAGNQVIRLLTPDNTVTPYLPKISGGGVVTAQAFGGSTTIAPGSWIEIFGANLAITTRAWRTGDFSGPRGPVSLDFVKVNVGGQAAFVAYVSPTQVNVQLSSTVPQGTQTLRLTTSIGTSDPVTVNIAAVAPGLYAPPSLKIGDKQYVGALFPDNTTYVAPVGAVGALPSRPAKAGDTIVMYGVGFGAVSPYTGAGEIADGLARTTADVKINIGGSDANVFYAGLTPGAVGLYQFNVVVPAVAAGDAVPVTFTVGTTAGTQTLYTSIGQ